MVVFSDTLDFETAEGTALAIGKFDGLHRGHMAILEEVISFARTHGLKSAVFTFHPSPMAFFSGKPDTGLLTRQEKRLHLQRMGVDYLVEFPFNQQTAKTGPEEFARKYLCKALHAKHIAAGPDLSFGQGGKGNVALLESLAPELGFDLSIIDKLCYKGKEISSSYIKKELSKGHMEEVARLLGRPYSFSGPVIRGEHLGHSLGFPTLNLAPAPDKLIPPAGVYYADVLVRTEVFHGMANIGVKPTAGEGKAMGLETHLLGFSRELYGQEITVSLLKHTRKEKKFDSLEGLKEALKKDLQGARKYFGIAAMFLMLAISVFMPVRAESAQETVSGDAQASVLSQGKTLEEILPEEGITAFLGEKYSKEEYKEAWEEAQGKYFGYTHLGIAGTQDNNLNIREKPGIDQKLVGKLPKNAGCEVLRLEDGWYYIKSGKVEGYVFGEYLLTGPRATMQARNEAAVVATSTTGGLRIREEPSLSADIVTLVAEGEQLEVVEELEGWVKVNLDDDELYVSADYVNVAIRLEKAVSMKELTKSDGVSNRRIDLVNYAKKFLGNPYVYGGTSLTKGTDCSGYVQGVFRNFGISLPRTSREQANAGTRITAAQLKPGDLIFYGKRSTINHVAIYIGNGQVINASNKRSGICIKGMNYRTPLRYVRVLKD
ncbi:MAG: bifunctional riboflavin kinase/FAD synthetase [Lachnospiraceae bacterium]|nr:bifunctional riboflavin kinase/FAD synthetase [Lachnospiraceae bacterium]